MHCNPFNICQATSVGAFFSLYQTYYDYWKKKYEITKINRMYYNLSTSSSDRIPIVFSYNYAGLTNGSYWGLAYFNTYRGTYDFVLPIQETPVGFCEPLPSSVISKLPIGIQYNFKEYLKNC